MSINFNKANDYISLVERDYFSGCFSESVIRDDLRTRRSKKSFYIEDFRSTLDTINGVLEATRTHQSWDSVLISRCEKCITQVQRLLDLVYSY